MGIKFPESSLKRLNSEKTKFSLTQSTQIRFRKSTFADRLGRDLLWGKFLSTPLGQLYQSFPFKELAGLFPQGSGLGRQARLSIAGGMALQVLKAYLNLSDAKLIDRLNSDWVLQYFCGIRLKPGEWIRDQDLVGRWRRYLA